MTGFINQLLQRHTEPSPVIAPRLPGLFEAASAPLPVDATPVLPDTGNLSETSVNPSVNEWHPPATMPEKMPDERKVSPVDNNLETVDSSPFIIPQQEYRHQLPDIFNNVFHQEQVHHNYYPVNAMYYTTPFASSVKETVVMQESKAVPVINERMIEMEPVQQLFQKPDDLQREANPHMSNKEVLPSSAFVSPVLSTKHEPILPVNIPIASQEHTTVIKVSIGRIEVKAVSPPAPVKKQRSVPATPHMSLEEYLSKRNNSGK